MECNTGYEVVTGGVCELIPEKNFTGGSVLLSPGCTSDCPVEARWKLDGDKMHFKVRVSVRPRACARVRVLRLRRCEYGWVGACVRAPVRS